MKPLAYARETLEATPARAVVLLRGIARTLAVRAALLQRGFTRADLEEGWSLLRAACSLDDADVDLSGTDVGQAIAELDAWDERGFAIVRASLGHRFPSQAAFLMTGLEATEGPDAVVGVATLIDRLDALEEDPAREGTRSDDRAAIAVLEKRGLGAAERAKLRDLVERVERATGRNPANTRTAEGEDLARLTRLRAWYDRAEKLCRATVKRPDHLVRLGLAKPRPARP